MRRKSIFAVLGVFILVAFAACGGGGDSTPEPPGVTLESVTVSPTSASLVAGETQWFTATGHYSDGNSYDITFSAAWQSSDTGCAMVNSSGLVTTIAAGTADISATFLSKSDSVTLTVSAPAINIKPVANAGADRSVITLDLVTLDGSASSDPNSDPLTYGWAFANVPALSGITDASLSNPAAAKPTFTPDVDGDYVLDLVVNDGALASDPDAVTITAITPVGSIVLPVTGQTAIYNSGDDGDTQAGLSWPSPRFTDNGDGTVTDNLTGLMWLKNANCIKSSYPSYDTDNNFGEPVIDGAVTWKRAMDFITGINSGTYPACSGGYTDWRLPNSREMQSLTDFSRYNPTVLPAGHPFVNVPIYHWYDNKYINPEFWTSTSISSGAVTFNVMDGEIWSASQIEESVWPVRSTSASPPTRPAATGQTECYDGDGLVIDCSGTGQDGEHQAGEPWPNPRFTDNGNGTVTDNLTGLVWLKEANCIATEYQAFDNDATPSNGGVTWQHALDFIAGMNDGTYPNCSLGYSDWRLPNIREMQSILNDGVADEAAWLNQFFLNVPTSALYWSSTTEAGWDSFAWFIGLAPGHDYRDQQTDGKTYTRFAWPVRFPTESNYKPVVDAGTDQYIILGRTADLSGSSYDSSGGPLTYAWLIDSAPAGSTASLTGAGTLTPSLVPDKAGDYVLSLQADDGELLSDVDTVTIHANSINCTFDNPATLGTEGFVDTEASFTDADPQDFVALCDGWFLIDDQTNNRIVLKNGFTNQTDRTIGLNGMPKDIEFDDETGYLYVVKGAMSELSRVDVETSSSTSIPLTSTARDIALAGQNRVFVSLYEAASFDYSTIGLVNGVTGDPMDSWPDTGVGANSLILAYDKPGNQLIAGEIGVNPNELKRYSFEPATSTLTLLEAVNAGATAHELLVSPDGRHAAYICGAGNGAGYTIFDFSSDDLNTVQGEWNTGAYPTSADFSPDGQYIVATNGRMVQVFDVATHALVQEYDPSCGAIGVERVRFSRGGKLVLAYCELSTTGRVYWRVFQP